MSRSLPTSDQLCHACGHEAFLSRKIHPRPRLRTLLVAQMNQNSKPLFMSQLLWRNGISAEVDLMPTVRSKPWSRPPINVEFQVPMLPPVAARSILARIRQVRIPHQTDGRDTFPRRAVIKFVSSCCADAQKWSIFVAALSK
jgi:hypothetical protein